MSAWPFQGMEWVIILVIVLLIFGPKKLPELARGLGQALYEFRKASQGLVEEEEKKEKEGEKESKVSKEDEELIRKLAEKMGISTEGKSIEELKKEIIEKAKSEQQSEASSGSKK
ncbi:twin-arginine translocation protein, TatA/E family subunit [Pyrolobus fumarii 1A]|uniref:Sec-independent protein translocase protein TatA n=1 Tax=Pyrolobus fumarii (strain DSM 11204 / 1A) TaxID=694429 RepID=G0EH59_PYRF1|nr:twin-arginine translocase TatA/TatE family subunit [Pyrolobus fumarii]AEM39283.1 twin-arginine translocation protein, TatA/E family subunit [Pyrolobus fumarii 1A]